MTRPTVNRLPKLDIREQRLKEGVEFLTVNVNGSRQDVKVITTPCNYGGVRFWFECPYCIKKCCIIYHAQSGWACRKCYRLCYPIENETKTNRAVTQAWKIRRKLGWNFGGIGEIGYRPKSMQKKTFERLVKRESDYSQVFYGSVSLWLNRTFKLLGNNNG